MLISKSLPKDGNRVWAVTTAPAIEPVSVAELKTFARIDGVDEDSLLDTLITSVRDAVENNLGRALIQQTITMKMDFWPGIVVTLPRPPLISVTAVVILDEADNETEYAASNYYVITEAEPGQLILKHGVTAPSNTSRYYGGYQVQHKAGYGTGSGDVPELIRTGIMQWATAVYEGRVMTDEPPSEVAKLLRVYRMLRI